MSAGTDTALAECDSCGEDVLPMFELRAGDGDADPDADPDVLCAQCAAADTGEESGE